MHARLVYSFSMTVFALLIGFYALLSFAVFFGETNRELFMPLFSTICAVLIIWTAVKLWRGEDAYLLSAASTFIVAGITGYFLIPAGLSFQPLVILILVSFLVALTLLGALLIGNVQKTLRG